MDDALPQPPTRRNAKVTAPARGKAKSVEAKEMELEEEEDEEEEEEEEDEDDVTDSDAEGEPEDQDESAVPELNVEDLDEEDEEDDLDEEMDSEGLALNSGKTTKRQRGNLGDDFLQLPMGKQYRPLSQNWHCAHNRTEPQVKKHLTAEERAMRRAEMARRRKNLSEKRNEEEKVFTQIGNQQAYIANI
jgi:Ino eighty subunit 2